MLHFNFFIIYLFVKLLFIIYYFIYLFTNLFNLFTFMKKKNESIKNKTNK